MQAANTPEISQWLISWEKSIVLPQWQMLVPTQELQADQDTPTRHETLTYPADLTPVLCRLGNTAAAT